MAMTSAAALFSVVIEATAPSTHAWLRLALLQRGRDHARAEGLVKNQRISWPPLVFLNTRPDRSDR